MPALLATTPINAALPGLAVVAPQRPTPPSLLEATVPAPEFDAAFRGVALPCDGVDPSVDLQDIAGDGKELPASEAEEAEPLIIWIPCELQVAPAPLPPTGVAGGLQPEPLAMPVAGKRLAEAPAGAALPELGGESVELPKAVLIQTQPVASRQPSAAGLAMVATEDALPEPLLAPRERFDRALTSAASPTSPTPQLISLPPQSSVALAPLAVGSGAAGHVFASALSSAAPEPTSSEAGLLLSGSAAIEQRQAVQAMAGASQDMLDLSRQDWGAKMIERIATLRDSAEIADTRIKLAPENLGALDISIRRDGDRIHVHFAAENAAARQLIAEATPRLTELAEARGLKLGQTSVDSGAQQDTPRDAPQRQANGPARNASASARRDPSQSDHRIA